MYPRQARHTGKQFYGFGKIACENANIENNKYKQFICANLFRYGEYIVRIFDSLRIDCNVFHWHLIVTALISYIHDRPTVSVILYSMNFLFEHFDTILFWNIIICEKWM